MTPMTPIRLHVSDWLLGLNDGPMLELLKGLSGAPIHLPSRVKDRPGSFPLWHRRF
jgi:hypothetical protein